MTKALFSLDSPRPKRFLERLRLEVAFDSALEPVTSGVRGLAIERRMVHVGDQHVVDLKIETVADSESSNWTVIAGQVLERPGGALRNIPAFLVGGGRLVSSAVTDENGSFEVRTRCRD